ncbi:uncharacterized protein A4U43_C08F7420 [Asparagus officinalis]|uniref:uncharacterized protein At1g15400-like n=1 Tax=Asparagus officinalis TaxID=4686 RepID=UPI00098E4126|nr:uncharacterized protein At1g15400-like [Asparagus officinalis]ONK59535.1 uncharacterized protein A4U43_C08F7420 [Asparagus officinalis]
MAGLQRSSETFRRSGSSGLVWEDRFLSDEMKQPKKAEEDGEAERPLPELRRSDQPSTALRQHARPLAASNGCWRQRYRAGQVSPAVDPPSPKLSGCGFCGIFGKQEPVKKTKAKTRRAKR